MSEDFLLPYAWFNLTATQGDHLARENRDRLLDMMNWDHIAEVQELDRKLDARIGELRGS